MTLTYIDVQPILPADACVIFLHGLGADGTDFADVIPSLQLPEHHAIRFLFPHAPHIPISINGGMVMPGWYDILGLSLEDKHDEKGIKISEQSLITLMQSVMASGIAADRIILVGFSQGGALALHTALRFSQPLGGVAALSSYLPVDYLLPKEKHVANDAIPIFMAHGSADPVVPMLMGLHARQTLENNGYTVDWHCYPMMHNVCLPELVDLGQWIGHCLHLT